jgi:hypothetical protein
MLTTPALPPTQPAVPEPEKDKTPESWPSKAFKALKKLGLEMWNGSKLLYYNTKKANEIQRRRKCV